MRLINQLKNKIETAIGERCTMPSINSKRIKGYFKKIETSSYNIYEYAKGANKIIAAYGDLLLMQSYRNNNKLTLYPYYQCPLIRHTFTLSDKYFPGLIPNSSILQCFFIPYMRVIADNKYQKAIRLIIITDKAQIFHNYPARSRYADGMSQEGDITRFEESVVWDIKGRSYPSKINTSSEVERFFPNLPDECYQYHPQLNTDNDYKDIYGNGGFGKSTYIKSEKKNLLVSRFYIHERTPQANPFHFIGTGEQEYKMSILATYRSNVNVGVRTCIFVSTDGGRQWYCKYEFADWGEYTFKQGETNLFGTNFGNIILNDAYKIEDTEKLFINKRQLIIPNSECKEPNIKIRWSPPILVETVCDNKQFTLKTKEPHGLTTGNIIALTSSNIVSNKHWMLNNEIKENSSGNNLLFKVKVLDSQRISLYELVSSPNNNIPCRHIHHVNRIKDGWLFGTGEIYPNGWLFYLQLKEADTFSIINAADEYQILRLNSSETSAQRTMGAILTDEESPRLIYASDHDLLARPIHNISQDRSNSFMRNSTGVYECLLNQIDNRYNHRVIFEANEPCFYFQKLNSMLVFCGQRGELAISFNWGKNWNQERIKEPIIHYYGQNGQRYYFDKCIIVRK